MSTAPEQLAVPLAARTNNLPPTVPLTDETATPNALINGAIAALTAGKTKYTDRPGIIGLRQWVANHLNEHHQLSITPNEVTITCGVEEARFVAVSYLGYGGSPAYDQLTSGEAKFSTPHATYILANSITSTAEIEKFGEDHSLIWDISMGSGQLSSHPARSNPDRVLTIGQFPDVGSGWRVGWMAGHGEHAKIRSYKQSMTICTPSVSQWGVLALLEERS